jgi:hypothetical protein
MPQTASGECEKSAGQRHPFQVKLHPGPFHSLYNQGCRSSPHTMDTTPPLSSADPKPDAAAGTNSESAGSVAMRLLANIRVAQRRLAWSTAAATGVGVLLLTFFALVLSTASWPSLAVLIPLSPVLALTGFATVAWLQLRKVRDETAAARHLAHAAPELNFDMLAAVELSSALRQRHDFSPELAKQFLAQVDARSSRLNTSDIVSAAPVRRLWMLVAAILVTLLLVSALNGARLRAGWVTFRKQVAQVSSPALRTPIVGDINLTYAFPAYTGLSPQTVNGGNGEVSALKGTQVTFEAQADRDVRAAALKIGSERVPLRVTGRHLNGSFIVAETGTYHVEFLRGDTAVAVGPEVTIEATADQSPTANITFPADNLELDEDKQEVRLKFEAGDDFGVAALALVFKQGTTAEKRIALRPDDGKVTRGEYLWNLNPLALKAGEEVSYYFEATDTDTVSGPKKGVSRTQHLTLYSAAAHQRDALNKAEALWERLVTHLADRTEDSDDLATVDSMKAQQAVDERARLLVQDLAGFSLTKSKAQDRLAFIESAIANISKQLREDTNQVSSMRAMTIRRLIQKNKDSGASRLSLSMKTDRLHSEQNVLYLEALLDKQKMELLRGLAEDLRRERRELSKLMESFQKSQSDALKAQLLQQMQSVRERMNELQARMAELAKGMRDEHLNEEAIQEMMGDSDISASLSEVERLIREGKTEEAMKQLQALSMKMDEFLDSLDDAQQKSDEQADPELAKAFRSFFEELEQTAQAQEALSSETKRLQDDSRARAKARLSQLGEQVKRDLMPQVEALEKAWTSGPSDRFGMNFDAQQEHALSELRSLKQALEASDFDAASESSERVSERAADLVGAAQEQRRLDALFQNPPSAQRASRQLVEKAKKDSALAEDISQKLRALFGRDQNLSEAQRQQAEQQSRQQKTLEQRASRLGEQMESLAERAPLFDDNAKSQMQQAAKRMAEAAQRLGKGDAMRGYGSQQSALQNLNGLKKSLSEQQQRGGKKGGVGLPMPMRSQGNGGRGSFDEKVEIPNEDPNQDPRAFRKDVMDVMKQGAPDAYQEQNKRYYQELVK